MAAVHFVCFSAMLVRHGVVFAAVHVPCTSRCEEHLDTDYCQYGDHSDEARHRRIAFVPE